MAATPWATEPQILALTGAAVNSLTRSMAVNAIELACGLIEEVERVDISDRDRYWLKVAVGYQAAWLNAQPDWLERNAVSSVSADGQSAQQGNPDWLVLAPLARKAVRKLSWVRRDAIRALPPRRYVDVNSEAFDDALPWSPLGGA